MGDTVTDAVDTVNGSCDRLEIPSTGPPKPGFRLADEGAACFIAVGHADGPAGAQSGDGSVSVSGQFSNQEDLFLPMSRARLLTIEWE